MIYTIIAGFVIVGAIYVLLCTPTGDTSDDTSNRYNPGPDDWTH